MVNNHKLNELIKATGVSKIAICKRLNVNDHYVSDILRNKVNPDYNKLQIIADMLHTTVDYLTDKTDNKNKPAPKYEDELTAEETKWLELFRSVSPERRDLMIELLKLKD